MIRLAQGEARDAQPASGFGLITTGQLDGPAEDFPFRSREQASVSVTYLATLCGGQQLARPFAEGRVDSICGQGCVGQGSADVVGVDDVALGAELLVLDGGFEVTVGGGENAHVNGDGLLAAEPPDFKVGEFGQGRG